MAGVDITEALPLTIAARAVASAYTSSGVLYDVNIGGLPFIYAISQQQPYVRETNDYKRQQIDTSAEPGEQTLSQWWVRDQDSWHRGTGILYYEPGSDKTTPYRFARSIGIDPWTRGQVSLLKKTPLLISAASGTCHVTGGIVGGADVIFCVANGTLSRHDGTTKTDYSGGGTPATKPALAGSTVLVGSTAGILSGAASGSTLTALWTSTGAAVTPWWVKHRIIAAQGASLYELTLAGGALSSATPIFTHPDANFTWTGVTETPDSILAAGYSSGYGYVFAFNLVQSGSTGSSPTLNTAVQIAEFPPGEEVHSIQVYLGSFVAIGTRRGVRIGQLGQNGQFNYGPLTIETTAPVRGLSGRGSYVYAIIQNDLDGSTGCARIDLSQEVLNFADTGYAEQTLRYSWAYDAMTHDTGVPGSIAFLGTTDRAALAVAGKGVYLQSATQYESTGYILSGRIRYATAENKTYSLVKIRSEVTSDSSIAIASIDSSATERPVLTFTSSVDADQDISLGIVEETPQTYMSVRATLNASTDSLTSPTLQALQVKATPNPHIQRTIRLPLQCEDVEQDSRGGKVGYKGSAYIRLAALEQLENDKSVVQIYDRSSGESFSAQITKVQFIRQTNPSRTEGNFGGLVIVTALKL